MIRIVSVLTVASLAALSLSCRHTESRETTVTTSAAAPSSYSTTEASPDQPINTTCPIMHQPVDPHFTVRYRGRTIGFCCEKCVRIWSGLSDAERDQKLASVGV